MTHPGYCKMCGRRNDSSDICDACYAKAEHDEEGSVTWETILVGIALVAFWVFLVLLTEWLI